MKYKYFDLPEATRKQIWDNLVGAYNKEVPGSFENERRLIINSWLNSNDWRLSERVSENEWLSWSVVALYNKETETFH